MLSRVADSLYWMSRYMERAEHTARLVDVSLNLLLDEASDHGPVSWRRLLRSLDTPAPDGVDDGYRIAHTVCFDENNANSIVRCVAAARENARQIREQISSEMYEHLNKMHLHLQRVDPMQTWSDQPHLFFERIKDGAHLFKGITDATLNHGQDWWFIQLGRAIERANNTSALLEVYFDEPAAARDNDSETGGYLKWVGLLKSCTAFEAYCKFYRGGIRPDRIAEFLVLDVEFPRSVRHCIDTVHESLEMIARETAAPRAGRAGRLTGKLQAQLAFTQIDEILAAGLPPFLQSIEDQCGAIHDAIYQVYVGYSVEDLASV
jgi:uncharacterized alpha-E superfamily protein